MKLFGDMERDHVDGPLKLRLRLGDYAVIALMAASLGAVAYGGKLWFGSAKKEVTENATLPKGVAPIVRKFKPPQFNMPETL